MKRSACFAAPLLVYLLAMAIVLRAWISSGFDLGFGDRADGLIEISMLEHWRNAFTGIEAWRAPRYFHPYSDVFGYNDGYLLYGLDYSVLRLFLDPFRADTANIAVFKTIGFVAAWRLAEQTLGMRRAIALGVALLFTIAAGLMTQAGHAQLQSVALLPVAGMMTIAAIRAEGRHRRVAARLWGVATAALMAAWLLTAYYMAWFTLYFALLLALGWLWATGAWRDRRLLSLVRAHGTTLAIVGVAFVLFCTPFVLAYLPAATATGQHSFSTVLSFLVWPYDPVNVGAGNYAWGWLLQPLRWLFDWWGGPGSDLAERKLGDEHASGFPLLLFILIVVSARSALRRLDDPQLRMLAFAVVVGWLSTLQAWYLSPWGLVYWLVPGAKGLRVVLRFQLFLILPTLLLVALAQRERIDRLLKDRPRVTAMAGLILVLEQLGPMQGAVLRRSDQIALLSTPPPPPGCTSFYVVKARAAEPMYRNARSDGRYPHNADAMLLAEWWQVPTINGVSTFQPPDWAFADPTWPDYDARVAGYARAHGLVGLCRLDARAHRPWTRLTGWKSARPPATGPA